MQHVDKIVQNTKAAAAIMQYSIVMPPNGKICSVKWQTNDKLASFLNKKNYAVKRKNPATKANNIACKHGACLPYLIPGGGEGEGGDVWPTPSRKIWRP